MTSIGVFNILLNNENDKILLVKRRDFPLWDLPGGIVEKNESNLDALFRETVEETGLKTKPVIKVGNFINKKIDDEQIVYISKITGGKEIINGPETKQIKYFSIKKLPFNMISHRRKQIDIAIFKQSKLPVKELIKDNQIVAFIKNRK